MADTKVLKKNIRTEGSMLGRILLKSDAANGFSNGLQSSPGTGPGKELKARFKHMEWSDPNHRNLVVEGKIAMYSVSIDRQPDYSQSLIENKV